MDPQLAPAAGPAEANLGEDQKGEQRARLIRALSQFKPRDANPQQFYNWVRELCIMHNCRIDEGLERAALTWPRLSKRQREVYDSKRHAELPIPVPRPLLYRPKQPTHKPPSHKPPKFDPPKVALKVPSPPNRKVSSVPPATGLRSPSPTRCVPRRAPLRVNKQFLAPKSRKAALKSSGNRTPRNKDIKPSSSKEKNLAKEKDLKTTYNNKEQAVSSVQRRRMKGLEV